MLFIRLRILIILFISPCTLGIMTTAATAADVTLAWDANKESDLAGYIVYWGAASGDYPNSKDVGNTTQNIISGLQDEVTYYFAVTAYDHDDYESHYSQELVHTVATQNQNIYTITASAADHGTITPAGSVTIGRGSAQTFSIIPQPGYQVYHVMVDGVSVGTATYYTFNNVTGDHTISAEFVYINPTIDSDGDGVPDDRDDFPLDPNETTDSDGDGVGNRADTDDDNDGMPDGWEIQYGLDPFKDDAGQDSDTDGINNLNEYLGGTEPNMFDDLFQPDQPKLLFPSAGEIVPLLPVLETDYFADPDVTDTHGATEWQLFRAQDQICVFDKISYSALTALVVPKLVLDENTAYEWRVKFIDNHGIASEWSEMGSFTTDYNDADADGNGITDDQEVDPALDLDEDGTPDIDQSDIKCVGVEGGTAQIGISILDPDSMQSIVAVEAESLDQIHASAYALNQPSNLPYGLISFKLIVDKPGDEVVVKLHLSHSAPLNGTWYKYDPIDDIWLDYSAHTDFSANRKTVYLTLLDGGFGDADGIENGIIIDPLGLSVPSAAAAPDAASAGEGGGSGAGCFIGSSQNHLNNPSSAVWHNIGELEIAWTLLLLLIVLGQWGRLKYLRLRLNSTRSLLTTKRKIQNGFEYVGDM